MVLSYIASDTMGDNMSMEHHDQEPSLGKLFLLALVSTRGTKLRYWKHHVPRARGQRRRSRGINKLWRTLSNPEA